eukprot:364170-Chlamydomonas_euryale.AAC.1
MRFRGATHLGGCFADEVPDAKQKRCTAPPPHTRTLQIRAHVPQTPQRRAHNPAHKPAPCTQSPAHKPTPSAQPPAHSQR